MRRRSQKGQAQEHENIERWVISYADFITLLFAFFVVMYAMSSINEAKYKVLAESMNQAFKEVTHEVEVVQIGNTLRYSSDFDKDNDNYAINTTKNNPFDVNPYSEEIPLELLAEKAKVVFKGLINDGRVKLRQEQDWLEIQIDSSLLFYSGGSELNDQAQSLLVGLADVISKISNPITVEGFTDDVPIKNPLYASNWELSASRAGAVVRALIAGGIADIRLAAAGYAHNFPVASNTTERGREKNRRVVILIEKDNKRRVSLSNQTAKEADELPVNLPVGDDSGYKIPTELLDNDTPNSKK